MIVFDSFSNRSKTKANSNLALTIRHTIDELPGFDEEAGRSWIYPINFAKRKYQFDIVQSCLYRNTLVALPTGKIFP